MIYRTNVQILFAVLVAIVGLTIGLHYYLGMWTLRPDGFSELTDRLPYWDFTNLWAGSVMALEGEVKTLFDLTEYRQEIRELLSPQMPDQEWSYPPSILLLGAPFALLPILPAYSLWTITTLIALYCAVRLLKLPGWCGLLILMSPAVIFNAVFGQNGALTAGMLLAGLWFAPSRPVTGGIILGLLTVKPHLGLLVPFCLLASRNYRAAASALATGALLVVLTGFIWGFEVWSLFLTVTRPLMTSILEAPYPQSYATNALTFFGLARSMGLSANAAYLFQAFFSALAIATCLWLWRPETSLDHAIRVCLTASLSLIASPYGYTYDSIPIAVLVLCLFVKRRTISVVPLGLLWLLPVFNHMINNQFHSVGILLSAAVAAASIFHAIAENKALSTERLQA